MEPKVLFEDKNLVVLNKPAGWVTNFSETTKGVLTIQDWLRDNYEFPIYSIKNCRNGIVHRLDKDTSGILLVAKNLDTFTNLQAQFKNRGVKKRYTALLHGKLVPNTGNVNAPVGRLPWNRKHFGVFVGGREAETEYEVKSYLKKEKEIYSLVEFKPKTGRTHQIRVHSKYLGHPIVADDAYAGRKTVRNDRLWCPRLFLHASEIEFKDLKGKNMKYKAELPDDLKMTLKILTKIII